jgi:Type ISP C-terminal specificity domain
LPKGRREDKFKALAALSLDVNDWIDCPADWRAPFLPQAGGKWADLAPFGALFDYGGSGAMPGRTWIIAPDERTLESRWERLVTEKNADKREQFFHPHEGGDKTSTKASKVGLTGHEFRSHSVANDKEKVITPTRYAFRSFDRQWIVPDNRVINRPNPTLWKAWSDKQVFATALERASPKSGPAITLTSLIPDLDHYNGRGGQVYPLWANAQTTQSNVRAEILQTLATTLGAPVTPEDVMAYIAAVLTHPAFTARFKADLVRPGLRVPLTADKTLFDEAAGLGREMVWLHCYGERFVDAAAGRPKGPPRLPPNERPTIPADGAILGAPEPLPETMAYDAAKRRLVIGKGFIDNVTPGMRNYEISGKTVLDQWFSYRRRDRTKPMIGDRRPPSPLEKIPPDGWLAEYTEDLLNLLNLLGRLVALEPQQADLLDRFVAGPLLTLVPAAQEPGKTDDGPSQQPAPSGTLGPTESPRDEDKPPV